MVCEIKFRNRFKKFKLFAYFYTGFSLVAESGGDSLVAGPDLLIRVASLSAGHRLFGVQPSVVAPPGLYSLGLIVITTGLVALGHVESSQTRDRTHVSCQFWQADSLPLSH